MLGKVIDDNIGAYLIARAAQGQARAYCKANSEKRDHNGNAVNAFQEVLPKGFRL